MAKKILLVVLSTGAEPAAGELPRLPKNSDPCKRTYHQQKKAAGAVEFIVQPRRDHRLFWKTVTHQSIDLFVRRSYEIDILLVGTFHFVEQAAPRALLRW